MHKQPYQFVLQFAPAEIAELSVRYQYPLEEAPVFEVGASIRAGSFTRENLTKIFRWKTGGRGVSRLDGNSGLEVEDALRLAVSAQTERAAISVLTGLRGVDVPVASAVLTAIDPQRYTIIDFRTLQALGNTSSNRSVAFYLVYLEACRRLARIHKVSLRMLDRALWQWSVEHPVR